MWVDATVPENLKGLSALVTGSTSGIGLEIARKLHSRGCRVIVTGRSAERCEQVCESFGLSSDGKAFAMPADLSDLDQVRALAHRIQHEFRSLDLVFLNSGMTYSSYQGNRTSSSSKLDLLYTANTLGPILLTQLLLPCMEVSKLPARIVFTSSVLQYCADATALTPLPSHPCEAHPLATLNAYAVSKLSLNMFAVELQDRLYAKGSKIVVRTFAPGMVKTNLAVPIHQRKNLSCTLRHSNDHDLSGFFAFPERRFTPSEAAMFSIDCAFLNVNERISIAGPYWIPSVLTWNRYAALGLWLVENLQKLTVVRKGLYLWPVHQAVEDRQLRQELWEAWAEFL